MDGLCIPPINLKDLGQLQSVPRDCALLDTLQYNLWVVIHAGACSVQADHNSRDSLQHLA